MSEKAKTECSHSVPPPNNGFPAGQDVENEPETMENGDIVMSLRGRDEGRCFFVVGCESPYVFLSDGRVRRLEKPKIKKQKHVKFMSRPGWNGEPEERTAAKIREGLKVTNAEVRRALSQFNTAEEEDHG